MKTSKKKRDWKKQKKSNKKRKLKREKGPMTRKTFEKESLATFWRLKKKEKSFFILTSFSLSKQNVDKNLKNIFFFFFYLSTIVNDFFSQKENEITFFLFLLQFSNGLWIKKITFFTFFSSSFLPLFFSRSSLLFFFFFSKGRSRKLLFLYCNNWLIFLRCFLVHFFIFFPFHFSVLKLCFKSS